MTYELALQLKNAGFPQGEGKYLTATYPEGSNIKYQEETNCYDPTLSELIEACGDKFGGVVKCENGKWVTLIPTKDGSELSITDAHLGTFDSIEEAVSKLWLELQK